MSNEIKGKIEMANGAVMAFELYPDIAPKSVANFVKLAESGFYDGLTFHRIVPGFVIQGGDPQGTGVGGPGWTIPGEFASNGFRNDLKHERGVLSWARTPDPNSAGSQFFIMVDAAPYLDELLQCKAIAVEVAGAASVIYTEPFMFYIRGEKANAACPLIQAAADPERFIIHEYTRKVYCIPQIFNKGASAERYRKTFGYPDYLAAGDSIFDLPMLEGAAAGFCPEALFQTAPEQGHLCACAEPFADTVCVHLAEIAAREKRESI